jgi:hypothetical protein
MSTLLITDAGINYKDAVFAGVEVQNITKFVFANIPGLLETDPISAAAVVPVNYVVDVQPVKLVSRLDDNAIVMSVALGYDIGPFDYNWYGAVATLADNSEVLIAVVHTKLQSKTKTQGANTGNYSVKSIVWRSNSIAASLNVNLSALPWQVDGNEFVSQGDFETHNHDEEHKPFYIIENETAITTKNKLHIFMAKADLQIPVGNSSSFDFIIDGSVTISSSSKCRLIAPSGKKIIMKNVGYDSINIKTVNIKHTAYKSSNGDWKI